jgi:hypothetical protein
LSFFSVAVSFGLAVLPISAVAQSKTCQDLFPNGIYDSEKLRTSQTAQSEILNSYCRSSELSLDSFSLNYTGWAIPGLAGGSSSSTDSQKREEKEQICNSFYGTSSSSTAYERIRSTVPTNAADIVRACKDNSEGITFYVEKKTLALDASNQFNFSPYFRYRRPVNDPQNVSIKFSVSQGTCKLDNVELVNGVSDFVLKDGGTKQFVCSGNLGGSVISYNTTAKLSGGVQDQVMTLKPLPIPAPLPSAKIQGDPKSSAGGSVRSLISVGSPGFYNVTAVGDSQADIFPHSGSDAYIGAAMKINDKLIDGCEKRVNLSAQHDGVQNLSSYGGYSCVGRVYTISGSIIVDLLGLNGLGSARSVSISNLYAEPAVSQEVISHSLSKLVVPIK